MVALWARPVAEQFTLEPTLTQTSKESHKENEKQVELAGGSC